MELWIEARPGNNTVRVKAPANENIAPRGYYMLFVVKDSNYGPVPSEAAFIRLTPP